MILDEYKNVVFYGSGISTSACYSYLTRKRRDQHLYVIQDNEDCSAKAQLENLGVNPSDTALVLSPAIPLAKAKELEPMIANWYGELDLALQELIAVKPEVKIVVITGSAGKTTAVKMLEYVLNSLGMSARAGGNVGVSFFDVLQEEFEIAVAEASSYQLEHLKLSTFDFSCLVSLFPNHLQRHGTYLEYAKAKLKSFERLKSCGVAILDIDHEHVEMFKSATGNKQCNTYLVSKKELADIFINESRLTIEWRGKELPYEIEQFSFFDRFAYLIPVILELGLDVEAAYHVSRCFNPPNFRLQVIQQEPVIINDSKSTSLRSLAYALERVKKLGKDFTLVCGGRLKVGESLEYFTDCLKNADHICSVICFGESSEQLSAACSCVKPVTRFQSLRCAATELVSLKSNILFSPGCESYDEFRDFEERGEFFTQLFK